MTAMAGPPGYDPEKGLAYMDVIFSGSDLQLEGGTGIYRHIAGEGGFATETPLRLYFDPMDPQRHVIEVEGSMELQGAYVRVSTP